MARSHEPEEAGASRVDMRDGVPKASYGGGGPESVFDSLSGGKSTNAL